MALTLAERKRALVGKPEPVSSKVESQEEELERQTLAASLIKLDEHSEEEEKTGTKSSRKPVKKKRGGDKKGDALSGTEAFKIEIRGNEWQSEKPCGLTIDLKFQ